MQPRLLVWALLVLGARAATADPRDAAVRALAFPNGPTVLLAPDSLAGGVDIGVSFAAGSRTDPAGRAGLAYVLARAALSPPGAPRRALEATGAAFDLSISPDVTTTSVTLPAEQLGAALDAVVANLAAPALTPESLAQALAATRAERARRIADVPLLPALERVSANLFPGHGYAGSVSGDDATLAAITYDAAAADLASRFAPSRALVTVAGRFDVDDATAALRARFGAPSPAPAPAAPAPPALGTAVPRSVGVDADLAVSVALAGWRLVPDRDDDAPALQVLARVLAGAPGARLERALVVEDGAVLQVLGTYERRADAGVFVVAAALRAVTDTAKFEAQLTREVERWGHEALSADEVDAARHAVEAAMLQDAQGPAGRATALAVAQLSDGDWTAWERRLARLRAVTPDDVRRAAAAALVPANRTIVWTAPTGGRR